jgi:predicted Rossmann fold nucleotide-binding protein DprA/Smf involved in DNA uptake
MEAMNTDTQATLLLFGRFSKSSDVKPLTTSEYNKLANFLHDKGMRPGNLLRDIPTGLPIERERALALMKRGTSLAIAMERWTQLGIRVVSRSDPEYPAALKTKLRGAAAPVLYIAGSHSILQSEAICIVGAREATPSGLSFAHSLGRQCAIENFAVVSGDARGVDRAAMDGAIGDGGHVVGVLVDSLSKAIVAKRNREAILEGQLLLISPYGPEVSFNVANAMDRNKYMYALSSAAVIVDSSIKGGTWSGAIENKKYGWTPGFVRMGPDTPEGNQRLIELGLTPIKNLQWETDTETLRDMLQRSNNLSEQPQLALDETAAPKRAEPEAPQLLYEMFIKSLDDLLSSGGQTVEIIARHFGLELIQAEKWLSKAESDGLINGLRGTNRYENAVKADLIASDSSKL